MKQTEDVVVFGRGRINYYPIMTKRDKPVNSYEGKRSEIHGGGESSGYKKTYTHWYPKSILRFNPPSNKKRLHPTQKPVALFEYLIKTYTNENELVLDNCIGSGTTAIAAQNLNRRWIGIELDKEYFNLANERIERNREEIARRLF